MSERRTYDPAKLRAARLGAGLTQEGLAFKSHITSTHISRLERSKGIRTTALYLEALAAALGCETADLEPDRPATTVSRPVAA